MSAHARFSSHARATSDLAVRRAYADLAPEERPPFTELLAAVHGRATVRVCPAVVAALRNLARFSGDYVRPLADWSGAAGTIYPVVDSLARHLLARHPVPRFLSLVWHGAADARADVRRRWFIEHGAGRRFRALDLPLPVTRQMEAIFLRSPDHLTVEAALRRAELLALGAKDPLVAAVLATRLASDLENGAFWRTVMQFFVRFGDGLAPSAVGPIVDFLHFVRHERLEVLTAEGPRVVEPPQPDFSIKGRSIASVQRLVEAWHGKLGAERAAGRTWARSRLRPMVFEDAPLDPERPTVRWELVELTKSAELSAEGKALRHCVASYALLCAWGKASIWSLRRARIAPDASSLPRARSVITIQVDPTQKAIVQARGFRNQVAGGRARQVMGLWARRERLAVRV